jgi:hypothetical protein
VDWLDGSGTRDGGHGTWNTRQGTVDTEQRTWDIGKGQRKRNSGYGTVPTGQLTQES